MFGDGQVGHACDEAFGPAHAVSGNSKQCGAASCRPAAELGGVQLADD